MRRAVPTILLLAFAAAAATAPAGAAKACNDKGCPVKAGVYDGTIALYVGHAPPYSGRGKVALLRGQKGRNPVTGSCADPEGPSNFIPDVDGTGPWVLKGKAPKIGKAKTYTSNVKRGDSDFATTTKATLKVKFSSAKRAKLSLRVTETIARDSRTSTCSGKGSWTVKR